MPSGRVESAPTGSTTVPVSYVSRDPSFYPVPHESKVQSNPASLAVAIEQIRFASRTKRRSQGFRRWCWVSVSFLCRNSACACEPICCETPHKSDRVDSSNRRPCSRSPTLAARRCCVQNAREIGFPALLRMRGLRRSGMTGCPRVIDDTNRLSYSPRVKGLRSRLGCSRGALALRIDPPKPPNDASR
jgi:hypothetical protein